MISPGSLVRIDTPDETWCNGKFSGVFQIRDDGSIDIYWDRSGPIGFSINELEEI